MTLAVLSDWLEHNSRRHILWYAKRLSGNDTLANGSHQAGPYIPKGLLFQVFPSLNQPEIENPDQWFDLTIDSHRETRHVRAIWYNSRVRDRERALVTGANRISKRNETRLTNLGGKKSPLLDPENTGCIALFAFQKANHDVRGFCRVWVCTTQFEEDLIEDRIGPVEPGGFVVWTVDESEQRLLQKAAPTPSKCSLAPEDIPQQWRTQFPTGAEIIAMAVQMRDHLALPIDERLLRRRDCEYQIFQSIEQAIELPVIRKGFDSVDKFVHRAQSILQRRKSRSGRSLELHARAIFLEEKLGEGRDFEHQPESETGKRPDFLFPNEACYKDPAFPAERLRMLATKTTCKDRWRQVLNEANKIPVKHILTLQEGISITQFREMTEVGVRLVVPTPLIAKYPKEVQPQLQSLSGFIADVRALSRKSNPS
jgi:hypothetical protein